MKIIKNYLNLNHSWSEYYRNSQKCAMFNNDLPIIVTLDYGENYNRQVDSSSSRNSRQPHQRPQQFVQRQTKYSNFIKKCEDNRARLLRLNVYNLLFAKVSEMWLKRNSDVDSSTVYDLSNRRLKISKHRWIYFIRLYCVQVSI